ncbi:uncharacterized protein LOC113491688 [Trichoplusia ni]|uniref:Uncharacterized protein LOC113491688 n=1 Tax=Trichoplusia ni TaxID=7111 RepID=A0A7E5V8H1_TRINI|nr:uncharacterized protein LOC113491688 [Trichoplusia ni]
MTGCVSTVIIWLMGTTIVILLIALVILSLALYLNIKKKRVCGIYDVGPGEKNLAKEESMGQTQYNLNDGYDRDSCTFSVNSSVIADINRQPEPLPATRTNDTKIIPTKKPFGRMSPIIQRRQMDEICREVLKRVQKSDSASFRDLNALLNMKNEEKVEPKSEFLNELDKKLLNRRSFKNENRQQNKQPIKEETKCDESKDTSNEIKSTTQDEKDKIKEESIKKDQEKTTPENLYMNQQGDEYKPKIGNAIKIEVQNVDDYEDSGPETEYDTVPSPVRFRKSASIGEEFDVDSIPVYDLPPRRSCEIQTKNVIHLDTDTQYLLPISTSRTDSCYINAKGQKGERVDTYRRSASMENPKRNSKNNL